MLNLSLELSERGKEFSQFLGLQRDNAPINFNFFRQIAIFHLFVSILIFLDSTDLVLVSIFDLACQLVCISKFDRVGIPK